MLQTGDVATDGEPQFLLHEAIPVIGGAGPFSGHNRQKKAQEALLSQVQKACESMPQTGHSPILRAVRRALEQLRSLGCREWSTCVLLVDTDLRETEASELRVARASKPSLRQSDNRGTATLFCGFTAVTEHGSGVNPSDPDALIDMWKTLFIEPVHFAPFCSEQVLMNLKGGTE